MKGFLEFLAKRYIAGTERADAVEVARSLNALGIKATIDNLGENVKTPDEARASAEEYVALLDLIRDSGVDSAVSMKLTHLGLDVSTGLAFENALHVVEHASGLGNFVRIDMEDSSYTGRTLEITARLHERHENVGVAIQSYLRRSAADVEMLIERGISVRLVKGAYKEPPEVAFEEKSEVDENFSLLMGELLKRGNRPAIATHDEKLVGEAIRIAGEHSIPHGGFEFEFLLGIKRTLQKELAAKGHHVRVYVPYGPGWLPYMTRRLRERRENLFFVLRNIFD